MESFTAFAWIYWDPKPYVFVVPYLNHPLTWYGLLFVAGYIAGFFILIPLVREKLLSTRAIQQRDIESWPTIIASLQKAVGESANPLQQILQKFDKKTRQKVIDYKGVGEPDAEVQAQILQSMTACLKDPSPGVARNQLEALLPKGVRKIKELSFAYVDKLVWFIVLGTLVGARLGHVFFYDWPRYKDHLLDIFKTWEGGLASHGGTIGVLLGVYVYQRISKKNYPEFTFLGLCDVLAVPTAFAVTFIRLGNFVNQEILGLPSNVPWAITFGHPADGGLAVPRHPAQLYEAIAYILTFGVLWRLWKTQAARLQSGFILGVFFTLVFGSRFFIEFLKAPQSSMIDETWLTTGQYLSIPFVFLGLALMYPRGKTQIALGGSCKTCI